MRQLFLLGKGRLEWREIIAPRLESPLEALVRPFAVAKCDLDHAMLTYRMGLKLRAGRALGIVDSDFERFFGGLFDIPLPFGHECVAEVVDIGGKVAGVQVGDVVSVPFQISCGTCTNCKDNHTSICTSVPPVAVYGFGRHKHFGGAMCDLLKVPFADGMLVKLPKNVDVLHLASLGDNVADAYRHVGPALLENRNRSILIAGGDARSIAIYSCARCSDRIHTKSSKQVRAQGLDGG
jgi:alcohol dehydrogenase